MHSWYEGGASLGWEVTPDVDDNGAAVCEPGVLVLSSNDVILPSELTEKIGGSSIPDVLDTFFLRGLWWWQRHETGGGDSFKIVIFMTEGK